MTAVRDWWWLAGYVDSLASWWHGLSPGAQLGALVAVGALAGLATGGLGTAFFVSGVAGYGLSHGHGLATLLRDPKAGVRGYLSNLTPQGAVLDAGELLLTALPGGTGAVAGRGVKAAVAEFAKDPDAFLAARQVVLREVGDSGVVRYDALTGLKRPNTWPETLADWKAGHQFNAAQWHRFEANEITLENGKRLDSYIHGDIIVSRKNSQLADLEPSTVHQYLREFVTKYPKEMVVKDTVKARTEFPQLIGKQLKGRHVLEVPVQAAPVPQAVLDAAQQARVQIRDITGHWYR